MILGPLVGSGEERVYEVHDWAEVHRLFHREGLSKSRIAERLGMSRNTVARLLPDRHGHCQQSNAVLIQRAAGSAEPCR